MLMSLRTFRLWIKNVGSFLGHFYTIQFIQHTQPIATLCSEYMTNLDTPLENIYITPSFIQAQALQIWKRVHVTWICTNWTTIPPKRTSLMQKFITYWQKN